MDGSESATADTKAEPRSIGDAVESLFAGATDALSRAANCNDPEWEKFYLGTAAAYHEWACQMEPLLDIQERIDEKVAMFRRQFKLSPKGIVHVPDASAVTRHRGFEPGLADGPTSADEAYRSE